MNIAYTFARNAMSFIVANVRKSGANTLTGIDLSTPIGITLTLLLVELLTSTLTTAIAHTSTKMPIYEYVCPKCKQKFEQIAPISACGMEQSCLKCGTSSKRIPSTIAHFHMGFYWNRPAWDWSKGKPMD